MTFGSDPRRHARSWSGEIAGSPLGVSNHSDETVHPGTLVRHVIYPIPEEEGNFENNDSSPGGQEPVTPSRTSKFSKFSPAKIAKAAVNFVKKGGKKESSPTSLKQIQEEQVITWEYLSGTRNEHYDEGPPPSPSGPPPPPPPAAGPTA